MAGSSADTKKRLALAITDFLQGSLKDGTLTAEDTESIEVATSCIADAFKVDPSDVSAVAAAAPPGSDLLKIYSAHEATSRAAGAGSASTGATPASQPSAAKAAEAEEFKQKGNVAMQRKDYNEAIAMYTKAIEIAPANAIYLSNRAAAYSGSKQHDLAKSDAELAVAADPKYTKGWSRLGLASFALGDAKASMEAYGRGIEAEGNGGSDAMKKGYETARRRVEEDENDDVGSARATSPPRGGGAPGGGGGGMPDLSSLASMLGGGGGGGGGGMPDLGSLMNNPMMRQMAQNVMSNPDMMSNLMNNPQLRQMADQFGGGGAGRGGGGGGGGQPDFSQMMNDPSIQEMARNFMGGGGGGAGAGRGGR